MSNRLEDYAMIGDCETAALVSQAGSIDWLCWPQFDSDACFAAILGDAKNGHWSLSPVLPSFHRRRYRGDTLILETEHSNASGAVKITDWMPLREKSPCLIRRVEGLSGEPEIESLFNARFRYGSKKPSIYEQANSINIRGGGELLRLQTSVTQSAETNEATVKSRFKIRAGAVIDFILQGALDRATPPPEIDVNESLRTTEREWRNWADQGTYRGPWEDAVKRSLITLKALTGASTGGMVAAPTTSLPEHLGGERNWDYRYCWIRDSTFTLYALLQAGYSREARAWGEWLMQATSGRAKKMQIMYGIRGERKLPEKEMPWLNGYENSRPVRKGNDAHHQIQLDVYGEAMGSLQLLRQQGPLDPEYWKFQTSLISQVKKRWRSKDSGIWEIRADRQHFTHSKLMAWAALDRAVKGIEKMGLAGPLEKWKKLRAEIHTEICEKAYDSDRGSFMQAYGSKYLDASCLRIPLVGFLPPDDPRVVGTIKSIQRELIDDKLVYRYRSESGIDSLPPGEGCFLPASFWLVDALALSARKREAISLFETLLSLRNDVGLLSEEYDESAKRLVGNFPQTFSHVGLINSARNLLDDQAGPAFHRAKH